MSNGRGKPGLLGDTHVVTIGDSLSAVISEAVGWVLYEIAYAIEALFAWSDDLRARGYGEDEDETGKREDEPR